MKNGRHSPDDQHRDLPGPGDYSERSFWDKLGRSALSAGREAVEKALWLYYAAQQEDVPAWARRVVYGALAYFIVPADLIPDFVPGAGYTDDLAALAVALGTVAMYVTPEVKRKAAEQMQRWFGPGAGETPSSAREA